MAEQRDYIAEVERIIRSAPSPHVAARKIVMQKLHQAPVALCFKEYAALQGVTYRTVTRWAALGRLDITRVGPRRRVLVPQPQ